MWQSRAALVATRVWKLMMFRIGVSISWPTSSGASTRSSGSRANTAVPSGTAASETERSSAGRASRNSGANSGPPAPPFRLRR